MSTVTENARRPRLSGLRVGVGVLFVLIELFTFAIAFLVYFVVGAGVAACGGENDCDISVLGFAYWVLIVGAAVVMVGTATLTLLARRLRMWVVGVVGIGATLVVSFSVIVLEQASL